MLTAVISAVATSSCATSSSLQSPVVPRIRWVFDDIHSIGGASVGLLGSPVVRHNGKFAALKFDGVRDGLILPYDPLQGLHRFTIEILFRPDLEGPPEQRFFHTEDKTGRRVLVELRLADGRWCLDTFLRDSLTQYRTLIDRTKTHAAGQWYWIALVYDGSAMAHYVSGVKELDGPVQFSPMSEGETSVGVRLNRVSWFKGEIREARIYDRALEPDQLSRE